MKGFTFIELLLGVLIIGALMLFLLPRHVQQVQKEHRTHMKLVQDARNIEKQLQMQQLRQEDQLNRLAGPPAQRSRRTR